MTSAPLRYSDIERLAGEAAGTALAAGKPLADVAQAAIVTAHQFMEQVSTQLNLAPQLAAIDCKMGCYYCCHMMVGMTEAELELLVPAVNALPEPHQTNVRRRLTDTAKRGMGLSQEQWWAAKLRCPLLDENGACLVHDARPLTCRGMNSMDARVCRQSLDGENLSVQVLAAQHRVFTRAQQGLLNALVQHGHNNIVLILGTALAARLDKAEQ